MTSATPTSSGSSIEELIREFSKATLRKRKSLASSMEDRAEELSCLGINALSVFDPAGDDWGAGWILQIINRHYPESLVESFSLKNGSTWFSSPTDVGIDFDPLQQELLFEHFENADRITSSILRKLAGEGAVSRGYVYFTEVECMPGLDLITIDRLWKVFSKGKFGFSTQSKLLKSLNGSYEKLWPRIGWKQDGVWTRYPGSFTWSIDAPEGHMPLVNQLRGVRLMHALLNHSALVGRN